MKTGKGHPELKTATQHIPWQEAYCVLCAHHNWNYQHITSVGAFDIDDIILNVLGGIIGYVIIRLLLRFASKKKFHSDRIIN